MRIAVHTPALAADPRPPSGAAAAAEALAAALSIAGHQVDGPTVPGAAEGDLDAVLRRIGRPGRRPDIWLTYGLRAELPDPVGAEVARALTIPYVLVDPRGSEGGRTAAGPVHADAVISLSGASAQWAGSALPDTPLSRLPPFIDPGPYDAMRRLHSPQAAAITRRHGLAEDLPCLLFVGAMRPGDRLESCRLLVRALSRLAMVQWQVIVVGDGPERPAVEADLRRLPLSRVHLTGGLPPHEVIPYYAISDLLVAPCVGGTHGRVLLEAQATGLPVVAGDGSGVRDAVHDGMTGRVCPAGNAEAIGQTIAFLLRERRFLNAYATQTTQAISKDHHIAAAAETLDEILSGLVGAEG